MENVIRLHYSNKNSEMFWTNRCRKWRNRFKIEKPVVLAEYFEQQTDCTRCRKKIANQGEFLRGGICIYLSLSNKWKLWHGTINSWPHNLRKKLEKYFRFHCNYKQLRIEARKKMWNCEVDFPVFLWNYSYNFENIFTAWS